MELEFEYAKVVFDLSDARRKLTSLPAYQDKGPVLHVLLEPGDQGGVEFTHEPITVLFEYWCGAAQNGGLPSVNQFDALKVPAALGFLNVLEPTRDFGDFRYRLFGTSVSEAFKKTIPGKMISDLPTELKHTALAQTQAVCQSGKALYSEHQAPTDVSAVLHWSRLLTPWVDDNNIVQRVISSNFPIQKPLSAIKRLN